MTTTVTEKPSFRDKHSSIIQITAAIIVLIVGFYLTKINDAIPRVDAENLVKQSEMRSMSAIDKLNVKQDLMLDKLEKIDRELGVIGERVGNKK
jgi:hypothetical protein